MDANSQLEKNGVHRQKLVHLQKRNAKIVMVAELKLNNGVNQLKNALVLKFHVRNWIQMAALLENKNGANQLDNAKLLDLPVMCSE